MSLESSLVFPPQETFPSQPSYRVDATIPKGEEGRDLKRATYHRIIKMAEENEFSEKKIVGLETAVLELMSNALRYSTEAFKVQAEIVENPKGIKVTVTNKSEPENLERLRDSHDNGLSLDGTTVGVNAGRKLVSSTTDRYEFRIDNEQAEVEIVVYAEA